MEFTALTMFLDDVTPEVPGCPQPTILHRLRWSAIEFCKKTGVSVETNEDIDIDANEPLIDIPSPGSDVRVWQALWARTTKETLLESDRRYLSERNLLWEKVTAKWPSGFVRLNNAQIRLFPIPSEAHTESMTIHANYIPTPNAVKVDSVLFNEYREAIADGALSKLLQMSKESWYDAKEGLSREAHFRHEINNASALAAKDFIAGPTFAVIRPLA